MERSEAAEPPRPPKRRPGAVKLLVGCGVVAALGLVILAAALAVGGVLLQRKAADFVDGLQASAESQRRATGILEELERLHPFQPPADGVVATESARRFLAATEAAWERLGPWVEELQELFSRAGEETRARDLARALGNVDELAESRLTLAESLAEAEISLREYVWTGEALRRAWRARGGAGAAGVAPADLELVARLAPQLGRLWPADRTGQGAVLQLAAMWGGTPVAPASGAR